jgi:gliding motility-associated-like protein
MKNVLILAFTLLLVVSGICYNLSQASNFASWFSPNTQPNANNDNGFTLSGVQTTLLVLNNDIGNNLSLSIEQAPAHGTASVVANSSIKYTPSAIFVGTDTLRYRITDVTDGLFDVATVVISVANNPALSTNANNDELTIQPDQTATIPVLTNDTGSGITITALPTLPTQGTATISNGGTTITYVPFGGFEGTDSFTYQVTNATGSTDVATVNIYLTSNLAPTPNDTLRFCTPAFTPVTICDSWSDPNNDPTAIDIDESGTTFHCSLTLLNDSCLRYTPLPGFIGVDTVSIVVCDDNIPTACSTSIVLVNVGACPTPIANNDNVIIDDNSVTFNGTGVATPDAFNVACFPVGINDNEFCTAEAHADYVVQQPAHGSVYVDNGKLVYNAASGYVGTDVLSYAVCNSCGLCDTATVNIQIMPEIGGGGEEPPVSCDNAIISICKPPFTSTQICPTFCKFATGGINTITATTSTGTISQTNNGCFSFVPPAVFNTTANITFIACGNAGVCDTALAVVTIDPNCGTNAPQATNDNANTLINQTAVISVLNNDVEPDGQALSVTQILNQPACGTASVVSNQIVYTPTAACVGTQTLSYIVCDATNLCDTANVTIQVNAPVVECDNQTEYCTPIFTPVTICVNFCNLVGFDDVVIVDAGTTFHCSINLLNDSCIRYTPLPGFVGTDSVFVYGCNNDGAGTICDTIAVAVHVGCGSPVALDDQANALSGTPTNIDIIANDYDTCGGNPLSPSILQTAQHGLLTLNSNGTVTYTANNGYVGTDIVTYQACIVCASGPICEPATLVINVQAPPPQALNSQPDVVQTSFNTPIAINVLSNDTGNGLGVTATTQAQHGTVTLVGNTPSYTPTTGYTGEDYFFYTVCDNTGACQQTLVSITVLSATNPIVAVDDQTSTALNIPISINVKNNDSNVGADNVVTISVAPQNGIAVVQPNGSIYYDPNTDFQGVETFTYIICNNDVQLCDEATVTVFVGEVSENEAPIAQNDDAVTPINEPITILVLDNDTDANPNDVLTIELFTNPLHGDLQENNGTLTYTPDNNYNGMDYFVYVVCDNGLPQLCDTAYVSVFVGDTNLPPIAQNDTATTWVNQPIFIEVTLNDTDPDNAITQLNATALSTPSNGTIANNNNGFTYTPNAGFIGTDTFSYVICDTGNKCDTAFITINVLPNINAQPDIVYTNEATAITFTVMNNDQGEGITVTNVVTLPQHGAITAANGAAGSFTYLPTGAFTGNDYFEYVICDAYGACDTTIVSIVVLDANTPNLPPNANNDIATTNIDSTLVIAVLTNDTDPNNNPLTITQIVEQPTNGTVSINANGTITYTPQGNTPYCDVFAYMVCDDATPALCDTAYVQISIGDANCQNQMPIAIDDEVTTEEDLNIDIYVLDNDLVDLNNLGSVTLATPPMHGTLTQFDDIFTYLPEEDYTGTDFFTYIVCNNNNPTLCDTAYVTINVLPQSVDAQPDIVYTNANTAVGIAIIANDLGTAINITDIVTEPMLGTILVNFGSNIIIYTPNLGVTDTFDVFEYQICDPNGSCDVTLVTIYIIAQDSTNIAPTAVNDVANTPANTPVVIAVTQNDFDSFAGDQLIVSGVETAPQHGTAVANANGTITYTPNNGYAGLDQFTYIVCDNASPVLCDTATVVVNVGSIDPSNTAPIANDDYGIAPVNAPISINILENDTDAQNNTISIVWLNQPMHGTITLADSTITYTPNTDFSGTDYLTYIICDNGTPALCDTAYVTILVQGLAPDTVYVNVDTPEDTPLDVCFANYLPSGFVIDTIVVIGLPANAGLIVDTTCIQYLPNENFNGTDDVALQICDNNGNCIPVIINIGVTPVLEAPIAQNDTVSTPFETPINIDVLNNDNDPDGDPITAVILLDDVSVVGANISYDVATQQFTYTPASGFAGTDSFSYEITDATGLMSDTAWVYITIEAEPIDTTTTDSLLVAVDDQASTNQATAIEIPVSGNDFIPTGQTNVAIINLSNPANGSVVLNLNSITYIPNLDFVGIDTFSYQICATYANDIVLCDTALVSITVLPANTEDCEPLALGNTFTPNGDGINDSYLIQNINEVCRSNQQLSIFNRWGDAVYNNTEYDNGRAWNGRWQNSGNETPDGTYFYILTYTEKGEEMKKTGFIELRR